MAFGKWLLRNKVCPMYPIYLWVGHLSLQVYFYRGVSSFRVTCGSHRRSWCYICWSCDSLHNELAVISGPVHRQQHFIEWAGHSDLDSKAQSGKKIKIDRNVMNSLGILSAILTDIGWQFRGDIIPKLPTAPVECPSRTQSHPINYT